MHVATLAALYGGLTSGLVEEDWATEAAESIRSAVRRDGVVEGRLVARLGEGGLDASLIAVATPFGLLGHDDPLMEATVRTVESELVVGPRRPPAPGRRVLRRRALGRPRRAPRLALRARCGDWRRRAPSWTGSPPRRARDGELPEQLEEHLLHPRKRAEWVDRWGPPARPLLWSHALFLALALELGALSLENAA